MVNAVYEKHTSEHYINNKMPFIFHNDTVSGLGNMNGYLHWHENIEFLVCFSGEGEVLSDAKRFPFCPDSIATINSNAPHTVFSKNGDRVDYHCLIIDINFCKENGIELEKIVFNELVLDDEAKRLFKEAFDACFSEGNFQTLEARTRVLGFLLYMCRKHSEERQYVSSRSSLEDIKRAASYIKKNYTNKITLEETAKVAGFSMYYFSREFKSVTGQTFTDFLNSVRCEKAFRLLKDGMSVSDAASFCGFNNSGYFSKTFNRIKGINPSEVNKMRT